VTAKSALFISSYSCINFLPENQNKQEQILKRT
jgi:hypothetical protein